MSRDLLSQDSVVKAQELTPASAALTIVSMAAGTERRVSPLGERILGAIEAEGHRSQSEAEAKMIERGILKHRGDLSSWITGRRGTRAVDVEKLGAIADFLHVDLDWLARGKGTMRRGGREQDTPAEEAIRMARQWGIREDAIQSAWTRNRDRLAEMAALDWFAEIQSEGARLERTGTPKPNPEEAVKIRAQIARERKKLERLRTEPPPNEAPLSAKGKRIA